MMKTDDLIDMLASGPDVRAAVPPMRPNVMLIPCGVLASAVLMTLFLGVRPDLAQVAALPAFWLKLGFVVALAWVGKIASARLSSPGARTAMLPLLFATPVLVMWIFAAVALMDAAPDHRAQLFWGSTWRVCPFLIAALSLPVFAAILKVMRGLAPTRLRLAGATAGFTAGAAAAAVYCLHCPEMGAPFVGFWYTLGILVPAGIGALIGPSVLRW